MGMDRLIRAFLTRLASEKGRSPHTLYAYESDLFQLSEFLGGRELAEVSIEDYVAGLRDRYKEATMARKIASLRSFLKYLQGQGMVIPRLPPTWRIREPQKKRRVFADTTNIRDLAIWDLIKMGLARSQIVELRIKDLSDEGLIVRGKNGKIDIVPYTESVDRYLNYRPFSKCDRVFVSLRGKPLHRHDVWLIVRPGHFKPFPEKTL